MKRTLPERTNRKSEGYRLGESNLSFLLSGKANGSSPSFSPYKASHVRFGERGGEKVARTELNAGNATFIGAIAPKNASTKAVEK